MNDKLNTWMSLQEEKPIEFSWIVYAGDLYPMEVAYGRYGGDEDPMPSAKPWFPWERAKYFMYLSCPYLPENL